MMIHRIQEILLGMLAVVWGVWLLVFDSYNTSPVLAVLREWHIPEMLLIVLPPLLGLCLLFLSVAWKRHVHLFLSVFWIFIAAAVAVTNIALTAVPVYVTVAFIHAGSFLLSSRVH